LIFLCFSKKNFIKNWEKIDFMFFFIFKKGFLKVKMQFFGVLLRKNRLWGFIKEKIVFLNKIRKKVIKFNEFSRANSSKRQIQPLLFLW